MITVEEALEKVLGHFDVLETEGQPLLESLGQVLAGDVYSTTDVPPLDNSAMDGFAVQAQGTVGATPSSPIILRVIGEVAAGYLATEKVVPGTAIRIMTGAPIPGGADAVVQFENTDEMERKSPGQPLTEIGVMRQAEKGLNIRRAGGDIPRGSLALRRGALIRPQEIGVLASLGRNVIPVFRRPVVAILSTGDELIDVDKPLTPGKIYSSNSYSLAAQVARYGGIPRILGIARDNIQSLEEKLQEARDADLLITSGGVSVGDYDVVKDVLANHGEVTFWTVRMKPGKPLAFGVLRVGEKVVPHLGLPGNPVSSMVTFEQFARPAIFKMMGKKNLDKPTIQAKSQSYVRNTDGRRTFTRVSVSRQGGEYSARLVGPQGSGILTSMTLANGLMIVPEDVPSVGIGDNVVVQMLDWNEETQLNKQAEEQKTVPIVCVVGRSGAGKTYVMERLVAELKRRGYRVATIKHDVHGFDVDKPGKDSWRHAQAGSDAVVISSPQKLALIKRVDDDSPLSTLSRLIGPDFDIVLAEGFKRSEAPKIEVHRRELAEGLLCAEEELLAIATDEPLRLKTPQYSPDDAAGLADLIEEKLINKEAWEAASHFVNS